MEKKVDMDDRGGSGGYQLIVEVINYNFIVVPKPEQGESMLFDSIRCICSRSTLSDILDSSDVRELEI